MKKIQKNELALISGGISAKGAACAAATGASIVLIPSVWGALVAAIVINGLCSETY